MQLFSTLNAGNYRIVERKSLSNDAAGTNRCNLSKDRLDWGRLVESASIPQIPPPMSANKAFRQASESIFPQK